MELGIGVDAQILAEEPVDDSWPTIGQTHHNDGLAVEGQGVLLNRDEFLIVAHISPLPRGVYCTHPFCLHRLASSDLLCFGHFYASILYHVGIDIGFAVQRRTRS
jgi:hypothetical protein